MILLLFVFMLFQPFYCGEDRITIDFDRVDFSDSLSYQQFRENPRFDVRDEFYFLFHELAPLPYRINLINSVQTDLDFIYCTNCLEPNDSSQESFPKFPRGTPFKETTTWSGLSDVFFELKKNVCSSMDGDILECYKFNNILDRGIYKYTSPTGDLRPIPWSVMCAFIQSLLLNEDLLEYYLINNFEFLNSFYKTDISNPYVGDPRLLENYIHNRTHFPIPKKLGVFSKNTIDSMVLARNFFYDVIYYLVLGVFILFFGLGLFGLIFDHYFI